MNALLFILGFVSFSVAVVYALHRAGVLGSINGIEEELGDLRDGAKERIADAKRRIREKIEDIKRELDALGGDA